MQQNVFEGEHALFDYLNPDNHPPLPLVEVPSFLNPCRDRGVRIFLKLMSFLPLGNVKSLPAHHMLDDAQQRGALSDVRAIVESSSGNTVLSLAILGRLLGVPKTLALVSHQVKRGKLQMLRLLGVEIRIVEEDICPDPHDPTSAINIARRMGEESDWFNPGQYENPANPAAHQRWTGPQIWKQTNGKITLLAAGLGTTGALCGTAGYLKSKKSGIRVLGVVRQPNNPVSGVRTKTLLHQIDFDWEGIVDNLAAIGTRESYETSLALCRAGLLVGPSSGFAFAGLIAHIQSLSPAELNEMRNEHGDVLAVAIAPDSPLPYVDEYFEYLGESSFPAIEGAELLNEKPHNSTGDAGGFDDADVSLAPSDCIARAWRITPEELAAACSERKEVAVTPPLIIIDIRTSYEFNDHHLPGSARVDYDTLVQHLEAIFVPAFRKNGVTPLFVCGFGAKSAVLAHQARKAGIEAYSLDGGMVEWSRRNLPRIKGVRCV